MKINYLITRMDELGGAQVHVRDLAIWMKAQGHDVTVMAGWQGKLTDYLQHMGVRFIEIPDLERAINPVRDFKALMQIRNILLREKPDILSCHSSKAGLIGRGAAWLTGIPAVFTAHGWAFTDGVAEPERFIYKSLEKIAGYLPAHIITVSEYDRALALRYRVTKPDKITAIHNGMPDRPVRRSYDPVKTARLIMVARVGKQKDHERLIRALWGCTDLDWTLDFIGGGDDLTLRELVRQMGMEERIRFLGERDDVAELMEKSDIALLISKWEGFPRSILEAMRAGLPVIASDVGGVREAVQDKITGLLVPAGQDQPLVEALQRLLKNAAIRTSMGQAGRQRYEDHFTFLPMATKTVAIYEKLIRR